MNERILQLIDFIGLTAIQFADNVGLNRSIIYHIKNGRSAPSLDVVLKILNCYPQISTDWLLYGKGEMMQKIDDVKPKIDLFSDDQSENSIPVDDEFEEEPEPIVEKAPIKDEPVTTPQSSPPIPSRTPVKMMIFYSDNSFEVFSLEKGNLM